MISLCASSLIKCHHRSLRTGFEQKFPKRKTCVACATEADKTVEVEALRINRDDNNLSTKREPQKRREFANPGRRAKKDRMNRKRHGECTVIRWPLCKEYMRGDGRCGKSSHK